MKNSNNNIETILNNAFKINRKGTKHLSSFVSNQFERPITHNCFFSILHNSNINLTSFQLITYMCHIKATDFVSNWKSESKLVVYSNRAVFEFKNASHLNINLNFENFKKYFTFFDDESLFTTDFGDVSKLEKYYK